jgi:hypothetical protein
MPGLVLNLLAIALIFRLPQLQNAFGILIASHCMAGAGVLAIFAFWAAPITFL